ncbi:MAG: hypothetical protein ACTSWN_08645 [Promethearchaeota archaeon]
MKLNFQLVYMFILFFLSFLSIILPTEKYIRNSKRLPMSIFTLIALITITISLFFALAWPNMLLTGNQALIGFFGIFHPITALFTILAFLISSIGIFLIYLLLAIKTTGDLRYRSLATAMGFLIWYLSVIIGNAIFMQSLVGPIMFYIGTILLMWGFMKKP